MQQALIKATCGNVDGMGMVMGFTNNGDLYWRLYIMYIYIYICVYIYSVYIYDYICINIGINHWYRLTGANGE